MDHISGRKFFPKVIYVQNVWQKQEKIKFSETSMVKDKRFTVVIVRWSSMFGFALTQDGCKSSTLENPISDSD